MLQHDETNGKFYYNGVEISEAEYNELFAEWERSRPEPPAPDPDPELDDEQALAILLGGAV